jgi:flagellar basal body-associated protein FliL
MAAPTPRSRKKTHGRIWIALIVLTGMVAAYIVYRNNTEVFAAKRTPAAAETVAPRSSDVRQNGDVVPQGRNRPVRDTGAAARPIETPAPRGDSAVSATPPRLRRSVVVPDIDCTILDNGGVRVLLSLELFFDDDGLRDEVMAKREQLKVMVRQVLSTKRMDEINVEPLRAELRVAMNRVLTGGALSDIEFRAFRIQ